MMNSTYKTLLSRGQKGCYIYCEDAGLRDYIKQRLEQVRIEKSFIDSLTTEEQPGEVVYIRDVPETLPMAAENGQAHLSRNKEGLQ